MKNVIIFLSLYLLGISFVHAQENLTLQGKKIVMIIADINFKDDELFIPLEYFKKLGAKVDVVSSKIGEHKGIDGGTIVTESLYLDVDPANYDATIFIGGSGATQYWDDFIAHNIAQNTIIKQRLLAAICLAPVTLANAGVLKNKNATAWPDTANQLKQGGANYLTDGVVIDGSIITAAGPQYAQAFADAIAKKLSQN